MILVYTRPGCAYCPGVKRYLAEMLKVVFEERVGDVSNPEYADYSSRFGGGVPLVINTETDKGVAGNMIGRIKEVVTGV